RRHTRFSRDWSSDVCSSDLASCQVLQLVSPPGELRVGAERRGLQIVAVIAERSSHVVPTPVDDRGRAVEWWGQQREGPVLEGQRSEERRVGNGGRSRWARRQ